MPDEINDLSTCLIFVHLKAEDGARPERLGFGVPACIILRFAYRLPHAQVQPLGGTWRLLGKCKQVMRSDVARAVSGKLAAPARIVVPAACVEVRLQVGVPEAVSLTRVRLVARDAELGIIEAECTKLVDAVGLLARVGNDVTIMQVYRARERTAVGGDHGDVDGTIAHAGAVQIIAAGAATTRGAATRGAAARATGAASGAAARASAARTA